MNCSAMNRQGENVICRVDGEKCSHQDEHGNLCKKNADVCKKDKSKAKTPIQKKRNW